MKNRHPAAQRFGAKWYSGNGHDGKHYWLTPPVLMAELQTEFNFDFDACHIRSRKILTAICEWGQSTYVNPPFGAIMHKGRKVGPTAWAKKALSECVKGKRVVMVYPLDKWVVMLLAAGATVRNLGDVKWVATEDGSEGPGTGRHIAMFVLDPARIIPPPKDENQTQLFEEGTT